MIALTLRRILLYSKECPKFSIAIASNSQNKSGLSRNKHINFQIKRHVT